MNARELLNRLTYLTLTVGTFGDDDLFVGTQKEWDKVNLADSGVSEYTLKQGAELLTF